jgi:hypothetical protein
VTRARLTDVIVQAGIGDPPAALSNIDMTIWPSCRLRFFLAESDGPGDGVPGFPSLVAASVLCENRWPWHRLRHRYSR